VPHYVDDPVNPGKKIDVHALQERDPLRDLEPIFIGRYLRDDLWTLREALQILAGYDPVTGWQESDGRLCQTPPGLHFYLDGLSSVLLLQRGLTHPRGNENLRDINDLMSWARNSSLGDKRTPQEWIDWARTKSFVPYWYDYAKSLESNGGSPIPSSAKGSDGSMLKRVPASIAQETAILAKLIELGIDPQAVPAPAPGKQHLVKEQIREALRYSEAQMRKAWTRLRADKRVRDA
jgi:hypothetical protein